MIKWIRDMSGMILFLLSWWIATDSGKEEFYDKVKEKIKEKTREEQ